jgi:hypothetical protein
MSWPTIGPEDLPTAPSDGRFVLAPLRPDHNDRDHAAWMSSIEHITATPGFGDGTWGDDAWPFPMSLERNLGDLEMHWDEFERGEAFAYTVLDPTTDDVIGCVYIDPDPTGACNAMVRSWVRASHASLDGALAEVVDRWLRDSWPFGSVRWPGRAVTR